MRLSEAANTSVAAIRKIELGQSNPSLLTILAIAEALGEPIDRLVTSAQSLRGSICRTPAADTLGDADSDDQRETGLSDGMQDPAMSGRLVRLECDATLAAFPGADSTPIFGFVLEGAVLVEHAELGSVRCAEGDSFHMVRAKMGEIRAAPEQPASLILMRDHHGDSVGRKPARKSAH